MGPLSHKVPPRWFVPIWTTASFVCLAIVGPLFATPAEAIELRIRARSVLDASVTAAGTNVRVSGSLRDELDRGLPQRQIDIYFVEQGGGARVPAYGADAEYTDRRGAFSLQRELDPGRWRVFIQFDETEHVTASRAVETLQVEPAPVDLRTQIPRLVIGQVRSVPIRIRASVARIGLQEIAQVLVNGVYAGQSELDQFGRGVIDVAGSLSTGVNDIRVRIPAGRYRDAVEEAGQLRVSSDVAAAATFEEVIERLRRGLAVEGQLSDDHGPLRGVRVKVEIRRATDDSGPSEVEKESGDLADRSRQQPLSAARGDQRARFERFVTTDEQGRFRAFFSGDDLDDGSWHAQTTVMPEYGEHISVPTEPVELDRTTSRWLLNGLGLLGLLGGLAIVLQRFWQVLGTHLQRRRRDRDADQRAELALRDTEALTPAELGADQKPIDAGSDRMRLSGMVWDVWKAQPVPGAELVISTGDGEDIQTERATDNAAPRAGVFIIDGLAAGSYTLEVHARGFMPGKLSFRVPHKGQLNNTRLDLVAIPLKIRRLYQSLVETLDGEDLWGRLSPREIEATLLEISKNTADGADSAARRAFLRSLQRQLAEAGDSLTPEALVSMMTAVVEETYFSGRVFDYSVWELARDIALRLRDRPQEAPA